MADLTFREMSSPSMIVGDDEQNAVKVSLLKEISSCDILNNGGLDAELTVGTSAVELKVGVSRKVDRKYVIFQPLDTGIKFGFTSGTQNIPVFKNQLIMLPAGDNTQVWFIASEAGKKVAIAEL